LLKVLTLNPDRVVIPLRPAQLLKQFEGVTGWKTQPLFRVKKAVRRVRGSKSELFEA
jgi:hypothetical protein